MRESVELIVRMRRLACSVGIVTLYLLLSKVAASAAASGRVCAGESSTGFRLLSKANDPPEVRIVFPLPTVFHLAGLVHIRATAGDQDGTIKEVRFYDRSNLIGIATNSPY